MDEDDPVDWPMERVLQELCYSKSPNWIAGTNLKPLVKPELIANALKDNDIDGENLLALEDQDLRSDLNITSFGQRRGLKNIISRLRSLSAKYQAQHTQPHGTALTAPHLSDTPVASLGRSPSYSGLSVKTSIENNIGNDKRSFRDTPHDAELHSHPIPQEHYAGRIHQRASVPVGNDTESFRHLQALSDTGTTSAVEATPSRPSSYNPLSSSNNVANQSMADVPFVSSAQNPSFLNALDSAIDQELDVVTNPTSGKSNAHENHGLATGAPYKQPKAPKRAILIPVTDTILANSQFQSPMLANSAENRLVEHTLNKDSFANRKVMNSERPSTKRTKLVNESDSRPYSAVFPGTYSSQSARRKTRRADQVSRRNPAMSTSTLDASEGDGSREFLIWGSAKPNGQMRHIARYVVPFAELVDQPPNQVNPVPETAPSFPSTIDGNAITSLETSRDLPRFDLDAEDLAFLQRYPADPDGPEYPLWGESDEEDRYTSRSEETPTPVDKDAKDALSRIEVDATIDEAFEQYRNSWRSRSFAKAQVEAHRKWMIAAKNKIQYRGILNACIRWRDKAQNRINSLRDGIHLSHWRKVEDIKHQCLAIEASIHLLEEYTLYVEVLKCEQEPKLPSLSTVDKAPNRHSRRIMENGDEELDSDDTDLFIVDDAGGRITDDMPLSFDQQDMDWEPEMASKPQKPTQKPRTDPDVLSEDQNMISDGIDDANPNPGPATTYQDAIKKRSSSLVEEGQDTSSKTRPRMSEQNQAATDGAQRNLLTVPTLTDSSGHGSDSERPPRGHSRRQRTLRKSQERVIDLTGSSPPERSRRSSSLASNFNVHTPRLDALDAFDLHTTSRASRESDSSDLILDTESNYRKRRKGSSIFDIKRVLKMNWEKIEPVDEEAPPDRRLALAKAVYSLKTYNLKRLDDYLKSFDNEEDMAEVFRNGLDAEHDYEDEIPDVDKRNQGNAREMTHLLITYATGCHVHEDFDMSGKQLNDGYDIVANGFYEFRELLRQLLKNAMNRMKISPDSALTLSDDTETEPEVSRNLTEPGSASKLRKPKVAQSKDVLAQQHNDQQRVQEQEKKRTILLQQQSRLGVSSDQLSVSININEPIVYLDSKLAARVKPHQVDGIRFMWREIIENPRHEGCLLAHTMGLGKTMQVIALLASIAQCNRSTDSAVRQHIPQHLQRLRIMILCPMALIENWFKELQDWLPDTMMLGVLIKLDNHVKHPETTIGGWHRDGGVLIIGYEKFQRYVAPLKSSGLGEVFHERRRHLIEGPDIVVADEAHRLKNARSQVNKAASQIVTKSRVAMTGSPLNNHLEEYHTMINWISPGYLGSIDQFKDRYVEPINRGLYSESTSWDRKASQKRLHMLKRIIAPKVNRADITAISRDLPPKTEFFLTIPLTKEQEEAYKIYVEDLRASSGGKFSSARIWSWLNILSLLLNHPSCFIEKLKQKDNVNSTATQLRTAESEDEDYDSAAAAAAVDDIAVDQEPGLTTAMEKVLNVFSEARVLLGMDDPALSNKSLLIKRIVEEAVKVQEKTLIFSKSIATLDYYENMIKDMGLRYMRIDGQKQSKAGSRQEEVDRFNNSAAHKVFLVSTKAGGLGLNIQSASRVIISDFNFNPTWEEQAVGRAYRIGQQKPVFVYRFLMGGTFEELIHNKAVFKTQLFTRVVDERNVMSQAKQSPGQFLFDPKEVPKKDYDECLGKDPKVLDKVLEKNDDCVRDIFLTETFFQDVDEELNEQELKEANEMLELEQLERDNPEEYARRVRTQLQGQQARQCMQPDVTHQTTNAQATQTISSSNTTSFFRHFLDLKVPHSHNTDPSSTFAALRTPLSGTAYSDDFVPAPRTTGQSANHQTLFRDDQFHQSDRSTPAVATSASRSFTDSFSRHRSPYLLSTGDLQSNNTSSGAPVDQNHTVTSTAAKDATTNEEAGSSASTQGGAGGGNPEAAQCRPQ